MRFADLELARRLERTEGFACAEFARARRRLDTASDSCWMQCGGADVVFDGVDGPTTQTFGLGLFADLTAETLTEIEAFFFTRSTAAMHEICPLVGVEALGLLCERGYRPVEVSNVLYREVETPAASNDDGISVRLIGEDEAELWGAVSARGWTHEHPELEAFVQQMGALSAAREASPCFLAEIDGVAGAAGGLTLHAGVALFGGAATVPEMRRRGLQGALLRERMRYAAAAGCDLAMMVATAGSNSQRNAERKGFRVAYTRVKWGLAPASAT